MKGGGGRDWKEKRKKVGEREDKIRGREGEGRREEKGRMRKKKKQKKRRKEERRREDKRGQEREAKRDNGRGHKEGR